MREQRHRKQVTRKRPMEEETSSVLSDPSLYNNRELSLLEFNQRVLEEAQDPSNPILERLRFLCIVSSNLDEFFETRVAELKERIKLGSEIGSPGIPSAAEIFAAVSERTHALVADKYRWLNDEILPALADEGVRFLSEQDWTKEQ